MTKSALLSLALAIFVSIVLVISGPSWLIVLKQLLLNGGLTLLWVAAATGIGWPVLCLLCPDEKSRAHFWICSAAAIGLGIISLLVLALGLAGCLNPLAAWTILAIGTAISVFQIWNHRVSLEVWMAARATTGWLWMLAILPAAIVTIAAFVPPGILWGDEPNGYDVVEYHLQVPRQWYQAGRITPLTENVFSYFPQGVEMHYLLAMELCGGPWNGMYLAQFMHAALFALAIAVLGARAGIIVAVTPWIALLAPIAYVEGGVLLYGSLAIMWAMRPGARAMLIAGAMAGFACGAKLTDVPMLLCAIPIALLFADRSHWPARSAAFLSAGIIVFAPWLIRTAVWTGNPLFPEAMNLLGHAHFTAVQVERWRRAYLPTTPRITALWQQILGDWRYGFILLPAALIAAAMRLRSPRTRFLLTMLLLILIVWIAFTHLQSRFFVLAIPIAALLIADAELPAIPAVLLVCFLLISSILPIGVRLSRYLQFDRQMNESSDVGLLARINLMGMRGPDPRMLPPGARLDLVGDASAFFYQRPMSLLRYRTVFDVDTTDPKKSIVEDWLNGPDSPEPNRVIAIDPEELARFSRTYYAIPPLTNQQLLDLAARPDVFIPGYEK